MSNRSKLHTTEVDLSGLLQVLGTNLYSAPEVAVRELVQNAHDACTRRRLETGERPEGAIVVGASPASKRIWVEDPGAGLTREEVKQYLATIGAGYTRVLRKSSESTDLIGAFGLGFLSAYMIGRRVEVCSTPASAPDMGVRFVSDSGRTYVLEETAPRAVGSRVEIELNETCAHLADFAVLARVLRTHCRLLSTPIRLEWSGEIVNDVAPPWRSDLDGAPPVRVRRERLAFAHDFEPWFEPVCTVPVGRRDPADPGEGLVWVHDAATYGSSDNRRLAVFVRGMRVSANERDLLPTWAGFLSGVYESDRLTPTASREALQRDEDFDAARAQIARDLGAGLATLAREEPEAWRRVLRRHNEALLGAAIADDDLFEAVKDDLQLPTSSGDLTCREIADRSNGALHLAASGDSGVEAILARTLGSPIIDGFRYGAAAFVRKWCARTGARLVEVGTARGLRGMFPEAELPTTDREALVAWFGRDAEVRVSRFTPAQLPLLVVWDEQAEAQAYLESDAADARLGAGALALARLFTGTEETRRPRTVVVNLDCPAVAQVLHRRGEPRGDAAAAMMIALADLLGAHGREGRPGAFADALTDFSVALSAVLEDRS